MIDDPSPGEERRDPPELWLAPLLDLVRAESIRSREALTESVMGTARWQYAARGTLVTLTQIAGGLGDLVAVLLGVRDERRDLERAPRSDPRKDEDS